MVSASKADRRVLAVIVLLAAGIFVVDLLIPLGVALGVPYILVVLLTLRLRQPRYTWFAALGASGLTILGFILSPTGGILWMVLFNRFLALFAIWATAIFSVEYEQAEVQDVRIRGERRRFFSLILIMTVVSLVVGGNAIFVLYRAAIQQSRERLVVTAQSQARLIEANARHDLLYHEDTPGGPAEATLGQIIDAHEHYHGFGETGEFCLGRRERENIVLLLSHRHADLQQPEPVTFDSELAEPMRRALLGQSGTVIGPDYRGEMVLAAYEPVQELDLGIVAKIDMQEVRAPFIRAAVLAACMGLVVILVGSILFARITQPMIRRVHNLYQKAQQELADHTTAEHKRRIAEEKERAAQQQLIEQQQRQRELVEAELDNTRDKLIQQTRLAAIGQVSAQVAHDIRNPLGAVRNAAFFLKRKVPAGETKWQDYLELIQHEVDVCDRIIGSLLNVTRVKEPMLETIDLGELVREIVSRQRIPEQVDFQFCCEPDPYLICVDPVQFRQVLDNLLGNALDAVDGSGEIRIESLRTEDVDTIIVDDSGPGVTAEERDSIFDFFFTTKAKGHGLGLAICRQIIERHGGTIDLDDNHRGTRFRIQLPRPEAP